MTEGSSTFDHQNITLFWLGNDTEACFDKHQKNIVTRMQLKKLGWTNHGITYKFNEYGFRSDSFLDEPGAMFLGCSISLGIGLPYEKTWSYLVSKKLNLRCWNLSQPGGSLDACYRLVKHWVPVLKPKYIFILLPPKYRREYYNDDINHFIAIGRWSEEYPDLLKELASEKNSVINHEKNIDAIKFISNSYKIPLILLDSDDPNVPSVAAPLERLKKARDLEHPGIEYHVNISNDFLRII